MDIELRNGEQNKNEGRPYRSHVHPACIPCRARKSRCKTTHTSSSCAMCQAHGTDCVFPQIIERPRRTTGHSRRTTPYKERYSTGSSRAQASPTQCLTSASPSQTQQTLQSNYTPRTNYSPQSELDATTNEAMPNYPDLSCPPIDHQDHSISALIDFIAESEEGSSHVMSPAIADDDKVFQQYFSNTPYGQNGRMVRFHLKSDNPSGPTRPIVFNTIPKRGARETESRLLAVSKCEIIEKLIEPHQDDLIDLYFEKFNMAFPIFDETLFRRLLVTRKEKMSPGLLSTLYGNTLIYWSTSPKLCNVRCPDQYSVWVQAEDALLAELKMTPGISTIITIILNISGRPSCHILGNGGLMGMAIALANAFGLNRDPSSWNLSPTEKKFRIRIWRILVIYDRWCSLAYGTPPLIQRNQHDVPVPTADDLCNPGASKSQLCAASCFVAFLTLTDVLGHCLEHVYHLEKDFTKKPEASTIGLERLLTNWEDSLNDNIRRLVIRGTELCGSGAANLRLAYLSVKLLIRRCQFNLDRVSLQIDDVDSVYYVQARRVCEEIVDFVRELEEIHCRDFWIPLNAYSLTSATTFLMRSALTSKGTAHNPSLKLARAMINTLQSHRRDYAWDIADDCLSNCSDLVEKIEIACQESSSNDVELQEPMPMEMDFATIHGLFSGFAGTF